MSNLNHLSLFTGIGGLDLAAEWAGFHTVGQVEIDDYCNKVLEKHWPDVPRWRDIYQLTGEEVKEKCGTIDIISGGFPCQPYSVAGRKKGRADSRDLWSEMFRVIRETMPTWVIGENVPGLLSHDGGQRLSEIVGDLESKDYQTRIVLSAASNYGAAFEGKRLFIIAASEGGRYGGCASEKCRVFTGQLVKTEPEGCQAWGEAERCLIHNIRHQEALPGNLRSNYEFSDWLDRIKALGNCVVPAQAYPIFKAIAEQEIPV